MRLVFLASGWGGVPPIGSPTTSPRRGYSDLVIQPNYPDPPTILVDASPHIWHHWTVWSGAPPRPDAAILTHSHYDHIAGLMDLRSLNPPLPVYGTPEVFADVERFASAVMRNSPNFPLALDLHPLPERGWFEVGDVAFEALPMHHLIPVTGLLMHHGGRAVAALGDTTAVVDAAVRSAIRGCDVLIVHTPEIADSNMHIGATGALALAREVGAKRIVLTHLGPSLTSEVISEIARTNTWVTFAYDGMVLDF